MTEIPHDAQVAACEALIARNTQPLHAVFSLSVFVDAMERHLIDLETKLEKQEDEAKQ